MYRRDKGMRRQRAEWMTRTDDEILEWLEESKAGTPKAIADDINRHNDYVGQRLRKLAKINLVKRPSTGFYVLTDDGDAYLQGDLNADELN